MLNEPTQTEELRQKMVSMGEGSLRSFTLDNPESVYQFEGEDYREKHKLVGVWVVGLYAYYLNIAVKHSSR